MSEVTNSAVNRNASVTTDSAYVAQIFNTTTGGAVAKYKDASEAQTEADRLNGFHNTDVFAVRSTDEAVKELNATGDIHTVAAAGDGTQVHYAGVNVIETDNVKPDDVVKEEVTTVNRADNKGSKTAPSLQGLPVADVKAVEKTDAK